MGLDEKEILIFEKINSYGIQWIQADSINSNIDDGGNTVLNIIATKSDLTAVEIADYLLKEGANPNYPVGNSALTTAIKSGSTLIVNLILDNYRHRLTIKTLVDSLKIAEEQVPGLDQQVKNKLVNVIKEKARQKLDIEYFAKHRGAKIKDLILEENPDTELLFHQVGKIASKGTIAYELISTPPEEYPWTYSSDDKRIEHLKELLCFLLNNGANPNLMLRVHNIFPNNTSIIKMILENYPEQLNPYYLVFLINQCQVAYSKIGDVKFPIRIDVPKRHVSINIFSSEKDELIKIQTLAEKLLVINTIKRNTIADSKNFPYARYNYAEAVFQKMHLHLMQGKKNNVLEEEDFLKRIVSLCGHKLKSQSLKDPFITEILHIRSYAALILDQLQAIKRLDDFSELEAIIFADSHIEEGADSYLPTVLKNIELKIIDEYNHKGQALFLDTKYYVTSNQINNIKILSDKICNLTNLLLKIASEKDNINAANTLFLVCKYIIINCLPYFLMRLDANIRNELANNKITCKSDPAKIELAKKQIEDIFIEEAKNLLSILAALKKWCNSKKEVPKLNKAVHTMLLDFVNLSKDIWNTILSNTCICNKSTLHSLKYIIGHNWQDFIRVNNSDALHLLQVSKGQDITEWFIRNGVYHTQRHSIMKVTCTDKLPSIYKSISITGQNINPELPKTKSVEQANKVGTHLI